MALACAALAMPSMTVGESEPPAAVLTMASGPVVVLRGGERLAVKPPRALLLDDVLEIGPQATATLVFPNAPPKQIVAAAATATFRVAKGPAPQPPKAGALARLWRYVVSLVAPRPRQYAVPASRGDEDAPDGLWACDTLIRQQRPTFAWHSVTGATYQVILLNAQGEELWRSSTTTQTALSYPDGAPELATGVRYWWEVRAVTAEQVAAAGPYWIELMPPARGAEIDKLLEDISAETRDSAPSVQTSARALTLAAEGFTGEALSLLATLAQHQPPTRREIEGFRALLARPS